jgi:riboflavin transporter FmnP
MSLLLNATLIQRFKLSNEKDIHCLIHSTTKMSVYMLSFNKIRFIPLLDLCYESTQKEGGKSLLD